MPSVTAYVDGLNLYHALIENGYRPNRWLDLWKMSHLICVELGSRNHESWELQHVHYFTSDVEKLAGPKAQARQTRYINALEAHIGERFDVTRGRYQSKRWKCGAPDCSVEVRCHSCNTEQFRITEKQTDVAIAVSMLHDCCGHSSDAILLITADQDLKPAVRAAIDHYEKRVAVAVPPQRWQEARGLTEEASHKLLVKKRHIQPAMLPDNIPVPGATLTPPEGWTPQRRRREQ